MSADLVLYAVVHETCGHIAGIGQRRINAEVTCAALHAVSKYGWRVQRLSGDAVEQAVERFASGAKCPACEVRAS